MIEHKFKKKYGQNFLNDKNIINKIINTADIEKDSLIIEIGPGSGALTEELVKKGITISYEVDSDLKDILNKKFKDEKNSKIIYEDFLNANIKEEIKKYNYNKLYIVANLPYYITTPIITKLIDEKIDIYKMVLMVQKEVGERLTSKEGNRNYSSITVFLNYYFNIKKEFIVSKNCFTPKPNVDSMIISLNKKEKQYKANNEEQFFQLIRDSFKFKRKTLKNNLSNYNFEKILNVLKKHNKDENTRAEEIDLETFIEISNSL